MPYALISVLIVSSISLIGVFTFAVKQEKLKKILFILVSFSAGALLGGAVFHLIPEAVEEIGFGKKMGFSFLGGIVVFFILEKFIRWRHCHVPTSDQHPHAFGYMNLVGDAFHNFIDGMIIAASYLISIPLGIATTWAVVFHEIPQEISDFGVLLYAGFSKGRALLLNFLTAFFAIFGCLVTFLLSRFIENFSLLLVPFAAAGFVYIAGSDLIPELHRETNFKKSLIQLFFLVLGIFLMFFLGFLE